MCSRDQMRLGGCCVIASPLSSVERSPSGRPSSRALSRRRMILPLRVCGRCVPEIDLLRRDRRPEPLAGVAEQFPAQLLARLVARLQRDERLDHLARHRIGLADHAGLGHGRVLHQRALHLERADQVAGAT